MLVNPSTIGFLPNSRFFQADELRSRYDERPTA